jgi:hypothetical protein
MNVCDTLSVNQKARLPFSIYTPCLAHAFAESAVAIQMPEVQSVCDSVWKGLFRFFLGLGILLEWKWSTQGDLAEGVSTGSTSGALSSHRPEHIPRSDQRYDV